MLLTLKDLFITDDDPCFPYVENIKVPENLHFGQLKLFIGTLFFLTKFVKGPSPKIVIPGGGSGEGAVNNFVLADLFPQYEFHLIDPLGFPKKVPKNVWTYEQYFTDDTAKKWAKEKNVYLISDIRTTPDKYSKTGIDSGKESEVNFNMRQQEKWHNIIKPEWSHLKFRFPFNHPDLQYTYLEGQIMKQCFAGERSAETRLIVEKNAKQIKYNTRLYEEKLSYHNLVARPRRYQNTYDTSTKKYLMEPDLTGDFDSTFFVMVVQQFVGNSTAKVTDFIKMVLAKLTAGKSLKMRRDQHKEQQAKLKTRPGTVEVPYNCESFVQN